MRVAFKTGMVALFATCLVTSAVAACNPNLAVVVSERVKVKTTLSRSSELLCAVATQLGLDPGVRMVLVQIHPDELTTAGIKAEHPIREIKPDGDPGLMYMLWLPGDADDTRIAGLIGSALADAAGIRPQPDVFNSAVRRAVLFTRATVPKNALLTPNKRPQ